MPQPKPPRKPAAPRIAAAARVTITGAEAPTAEQPARFTMVAYTGEPMRIYPWADPVVVDLETCDVSEPRIPALYDHYADIGSVVGQVETLAVENKQLVAAGRFTPIQGDASGYRRNCAADVLALAKTGYQWQASVGADPATVEEIKAGAVGVANWGREYPGPCVIGRGCRFRELSFVVLGGDRKTSVVAGRHRVIKGSAVNPTYEEWLTSLGFADPTALDPTQDANMRLLYAEEYPESGTEAEPPAEPAGVGEQVAAEGDPPAMTDEEKKKAAADALAARGRRPAVRGTAADPVADLRRRSAAELTRQADVQRIAAEYGNPTIQVGTRQVPLAAHAVAQNWSADKTENAAIKASRPSGPHLHMPAGSGRGPATNLVLEAAICAALKQPNLEKQFRPEVLDAAHTQFRGRIGLQQVMFIAAAAGGYHPGPGERLHNGNLKAVLKAASADPAIKGAAGTSTVSLPGIFANVANKELLTGYLEEDQSWREVAAVKPVNDFKSVTSYRLLDDMAYEQVGPNGEIKHGKVSEESYSRQAKTYAKMFILTRRDQINDDLGAFADLRNRLGRGAAQKFNDVFWTEFLSDAATFWTTARTNYISGATTNLGTDGVGLGLGVKAFRQMTSPSGDGTKRVGGNPEILLVPPELEGVAEVLYRNQNLGGVKSSDANIYANKYRPVVVPWLSDSGFTGYSTTAWYLLRSPGLMPAVVASFLFGNEAPTVEDSDADFDTLGWQFRGYHDFGVDQAEYLCGVKSKGAA
jgi:phage major head subunit gpT-like protein